MKSIFISFANLGTMFVNAAILARTESVYTGILCIVLIYISSFGYCINGEK